MNHHLQTILVISITASLAYIVALLSIDGTIYVANFGPAIALAIFSFAFSLLFTVGAAHFSSSKGNKAIKYEKWAVRTFVIGFIWTMGVSVYVMIMTYFDFGNMQERLMLIIVVILSAGTGFILGRKRK